MITFELRSKCEFKDKVKWCEKIGSQDYAPKAS